MSISIDNLTKIYGQQKAVDQISFSIDAGEIVGFLGPNGAGKSTTMKILTGYIPATSGSVSVLGMDVAKKPLEVKKTYRLFTRAQSTLYRYVHHRVSEI